MSFQRMQQVFADTTVTNPTDRFVLMALAYHENPKDGLCFPSIETLTKETCYNERTVWRAVERLTSSGAVAKVSGGGRNISNRYRITRETLAQSQGLAKQETLTQSQKTLAENPETLTQSQQNPGTGPGEVKVTVMERQVNITDYFSRKKQGEGNPSRDPDGRSGASPTWNEILAKFKPEFPEIDVYEQFDLWPQRRFDVSDKWIKSLRGWLAKAVELQTLKQMGERKYEKKKADTKAPSNKKEAPKPVAVELSDDDYDALESACEKMDAIVAKELPAFLPVGDANDKKRRALMIAAVAKWIKAHDETGLINAQDYAKELVDDPSLFGCSAYFPFGCNGWPDWNNKYPDVQPIASDELIVMVDGMPRLKAHSRKAA